MTSEADPPTKKAQYRIVTDGEFGELLSAAFRDASIEVLPSSTELVVQVVDDQELYGILDRLRDHAVRVVSFHREH